MVVTNYFSSLDILGEQQLYVFLIYLLLAIKLILYIK